MISTSDGMGGPKPPTGRPACAARSAGGVRAGRIMHSARPVCRRDCGAAGCRGAAGAAGRASGAGAAQTPPERIGAAGEFRTLRSRGPEAAERPVVVRGNGIPHHHRALSAPAHLHRRALGRGRPRLPRQSGLVWAGVAPTKNGFSTPYVELDRPAWAALRDSTPLPLTEDDLEVLRGTTDPTSLDDVRDIYLPLSRLLNLYVSATRQRHAAVRDFLGEGDQPVPFIIGVAGSVAVGKSTTARLLRTLLAQWPDHPNVELVSTDNFLHPNTVLQERGIMNRKGFPESYDRRALVRFVSEMKAGAPRMEIPVYSHLAYDLVAGETQTVQRPDILIVE